MSTSEISIKTLFEKYSNRETKKGTDKVLTHTYGDIYDALFTPRKNTTKNILEIGISGGFGLLCYAHYFKNATIYGIDIEDNIQADIKNHHRIKLFFDDAHKDSLIKSLPSFDIIIEDASHELRDQITHFVEYSSLVKPNGVYIIEDIDGTNLDKLVDVLSPFATVKDFDMALYDGRQYNNRGDDILLIFTKK